MDQTEEQVIAAARRGGAEAYGWLVQMYQDRVFALTLRMTGDRQAAEDLTQEAFLRAYQKLDTYRGEARFYTWLYRVAINLCLRHLEREKRLVFADWPEISEGGGEVLADDALSPEELALREEVKVGCLTGLIRCLSREQRAAFVLSVLLDLPDRDVAVVLGCSLGAAKARLHRARQTLIGFLERRCQWIDSDNQCRCHKWIERAVEQGLIDARSVDPDRPLNVEPIIEELDSMQRMVHVYRSLPTLAPSDDLIARIRQGIARGEWQVLA